MKEFQLIKKYFSNLSKDNPGSFELTDDVFFDRYKKLVISVDTYVEGVHFFNFNNPDLVIKKILRSSISDIICKGVKPELYFLSGSGNKRSFSKKNLELISNALKSEQKKFKIKLGGGDTTYSSKLSFTFVSVGYSSNIVKRNNGKIYLDRHIKIDHQGSKSVNSTNKFELEKNRNWHWMWSTFYFHKKYKGFFLAFIIVFPKLFSAFVKTIIYSLLLNKNKRDIYFCRLSGIVNSIVGNKSWYRPSLD